MKSSGARIPTHFDPSRKTNIPQLLERTRANGVNTANISCCMDRGRSGWAEQG
jgi:hypothetical protein